MATNTPQIDYQKTALRLPKDLHVQLHAAAQETGRSYNAEIVARLQSSFEGGGNAAEAYEKLAIAGFVMKLLQNLIQDEVIKRDVATMLKYLDADKAQEDPIAAIAAFTRMQGEVAKNTTTPKT